MAIKWNLLFQKNNDDEKAEEKDIKKEKDAIKDKENKKDKKKSEDEDETVKELSRRPGVIAYLGKNWRGIFLGQKDDSRSLLDRAFDAVNGYQEVLERHEKVTNAYEVISESSYLRREFFVLLIGSAFIASFGLFQNSAAVIIGAMLIAPLMGPILGFALGSIWGDRHLLSQSALTLFVGTLSVLIVSTFFSLIVPGIEMNDQIIARIHPNLYDILIALASGLVGSYAFVNPKISNSISGVAIAVALVPPLCVTGITLGQFDMQAALGSFLLYLSNLVGISLAASFIFWRMRVHPVETEEEEVSERAKKKIGVSMVVLVLIAVPLTYFTLESLRLKNHETNARQIIEAKLPEGDVMELRVNRFADGYVVIAKILTPFLEQSGEAIEPGATTVLPGKVASEQGRLKNIKHEIEELIRAGFEEPVKIQVILIPAHM